MEGYKETKLGWIPEEWEVVKLGEVIGELSSGTSVLSEDISAKGDEIGILKTSCVSGGKFLPDENKTVLEEEVDRVSVSPKADTIIISRMNTPQLVGEVGYVETAEPNLYLPDRLWLTQKIDRAIISVKFLSYWLSSNYFRTRLSILGTGTSGSMKNISQRSFLRELLPLPPKAEQEKIAAILGTVDARREGLEQRIAATETLKKGLMQRLFREGTGHTEFQDSELGRIPKGWEVVKLGEVVRKRSQSIIPNNEICIELEHIEGHNGRLLGFDFLEGKGSLKKVFFPGDVLFSKLRPYLNKFWLADQEGFCSSEFLVLEAEQQLTHRFIYNIIQTQGFLNFAVKNSFGTKMPRTSWKLIKSYPIPLPPKAEQEKIAALLGTVDERLENLRAQVVTLDELKRGLMQQLLTGRMRVKALAQTALS